MKTTEGDLIQKALDGEFDVLIHGCNCYCAMGAGIAKQIAKEFPEAEHVDKQTVRGDLSKLGSYTTIAYAITNTANQFQSLHIVNGYTQNNYGRGLVNVDYDAIRTLFKAIKRDFSGLRIGYPLIGCGLAGGDWSIVEPIINEELEGEDHTLVLYK